MYYLSPLRELSQYSGTWRALFKLYSRYMRDEQYRGKYSTFDEDNYLKETYV